MCSINTQPQMSARILEIAAQLAEGEDVVDLADRVGAFALLRRAGTDEDHRSFLGRDLCQQLISFVEIRG